MAHHESQPTDAKPEQCSSFPTAEKGKTSIDCQVPQQSQDIDLNRQEESREDVGTAQLMDVPISKGHHEVLQSRLNEDITKEGPMEGPVNVRRRNTNCSLSRR